MIGISRRSFIFPRILHLLGRPASMLIFAQSEQEHRVFLEMTDILFTGQEQPIKIIVGHGRLMEFSLQDFRPAMAEAQRCGEQQGYVSLAPNSPIR